MGARLEEVRCIGIGQRNRLDAGDYRVFEPRRQGRVQQPVLYKFRWPCLEPAMGQLLPSWSGRGGNLELRQTAAVQREELVCRTHFVEYGLLFVGGDEVGDIEGGWW